MYLLLRQLLIALQGTWHWSGVQIMILESMELHQGPIGDTAGVSKLAPDEILNKERQHMPLFKLGEKWDIAMAAIYLASDAASSSHPPWMRYCAEKDF
ncbi:hypothetical protein Pint_12136 [Pistacia integerrima]|uniref:Uncharacterized protein n=1 Tax=Pistacia integerrima TaxID=434235 RepID=A0ACC0XHE8_9ROSI|nr:hypothetical protein Pint_12136 [Pistacia integerrima]